MKILKSLVIVVAMAAMVAGATSSVFTSSASVTGNTFSTGTLQIRINGQSSIPGFTVTNAAPGDSTSGSFDINNYGAPWFVGPSTLAAKTLTLGAANMTGSPDLYSELQIVVTVNAGGPAEQIYNGPLASFVDSDALVSYYHANGLIPGSSETVNYTVTLPSGADNSYMGLSTTFDFVATATSS